MGASAECCTERIAPLPIEENDSAWNDPTTKTLLVVDKNSYLHTTGAHLNRDSLTLRQDLVMLMSLTYKDLHRPSPLEELSSNRCEKLLKSSVKIFNAQN